MAAMVSVEVRGLPAVKREIRRAVEQHAVKIATTLETSLRALTPVRTGRARSGWQRQTQPGLITIQNRVPYVPYLDQGTRRMRAANSGRGIIGPALQQSKGKFK
jgi:fumarate hydratase class II